MLGLLCFCEPLSIQTLEQQVFNNTAIFRCPLQISANWEPPCWMYSENVFQLTNSWTTANIWTTVGFLKMSFQTQTSCVIILRCLLGGPAQLGGARLGTICTTCKRSYSLNWNFSVHFMSIDSAASPMRHSGTIWGSAQPLWTLLQIQLVGSSWQMG